MMTKMLVKTWNYEKEEEYYQEYKCDSMISTNPKEIQNFLHKNPKICSFYIWYAVNRDVEEIYAVYCSKKPTLKTIKAFVDIGCTEWLYNWAFAGEKFKLDSGKIVKAITVDLDICLDIEELIRNWRKSKKELENVKQQILWYNKVHRHDESKLNIANAALMLIADISLGYDSYNSLNDLKYLVDELRMIAVAGLNMTYGKEDPNGTIRI